MLSQKALVAHCADQLQEQRSLHARWRAPENPVFSLMKGARQSPSRWQSISCRRAMQLLRGRMREEKTSEYHRFAFPRPLLLHREKAGSATCIFVMPESK